MKLVRVVFEAGRPTTMRRTLRRAHAGISLAPLLALHDGGAPISLEVAALYKVTLGFRPAGRSTERSSRPPQGIRRAHRLDLAPEETSISSVLAKEIMSEDMLTVTPDTPAKEAAMLLVDHKIGSRQ